MRLLKLDHLGGFHLTENFVEGEIPPYAILSHTWGVDKDGVSFDDLQKGSDLKQKAGFQKLTFCAQKAMEDGLDYFWVDTCCINRADFTELSETIVSMFRWYQNAAVCYAYLSDVEHGRDVDALTDQPIDWEQFQHCKWFTRDWTLQELIAPKIVKFYSGDGLLLGDKSRLKQRIHAATNVWCKQQSLQYTKAS